VPELPEVETVVRDLRPLLVKKRITAAAASDRSLRRTRGDAWSLEALVGHTFQEVRRRGKWIVLALSGDRSLVIHLGMTGRLTVVAEEEPVEPHTHLTLGLRPGRRQLRFNDVRRFGSASFFAGQEALERFFAEVSLGPEPFDLAAAEWRDRLAATRRSLKAVLLDQRVLAGVGNIYADESLYEARLPPTRLACDVSSADAERLRKAVVKVLTRAIERRGSSIRNYVGGSGLKGEYQDEFRVYGRAGDPCRRCRAPIVGIRLAGRSTHYCPRCQTSDGG
jgi:formamidopyrimidine-DNA glycosylase